MHDDTGAIQTALNLFSNQLRTGRIVFPPGTYRTTAGLLYQGNYSYTVHLEGLASAGGPSGVVIAYDGTLGAAEVSVLEIRGGVDVTVEGITIDASRAQYGLYLRYDRSRSMGVTNVVINRCHVLGADSTSAPVNSACVSLGSNYDGSADTFQCDSIKISNCRFWGHRCNVVTGEGNVANITLTGCGLVGADYLIHRRSGSTFSVRDCAGGSSGIADFKSSFGKLLVDCWYSEGSAGLLEGMGQTANVGQVEISNSSWSGYTPGRVIVRHAGTLILRNNYFQNLNPGGLVPAIDCQPVAGNGASLISEGNFYLNARSHYTGLDGTPVIQDGWGNSLLTSQVNNYYHYLIYIRTFGGIGGAAGSLIKMPNRGVGSDVLTTGATSARTVADALALVARSLDVSGAIQLATLTDDQAPAGSLYLSATRVDSSGCAQLCKKDALGNISAVVQ